jgi:hypothetical protein
MELIFDGLRHERLSLGHLMPYGGGIIPGKLMTAL